MTSRHLSRRPVLPVLAALLVGATTAATATLLANPTDALTGAGADVSASSFTQVPWPGRAVRPAGPRPAATAPNTKTQEPAPTTTAPTTTPPAPTTTTTPPPTAAEPPPPSPPAPPAAAIDRVVELVNLARVENGCDPVRVDADLTEAATAHSEDMSRRDYFSHTTPEGVTFDKRILEAGYSTPGAENIARGQETADEVMDAWMKSKGHKANILNCELTTIGVGLDTDGFYWVQDFGY
ncbi:MAG TPA: CAP domain-containing protein [Actinophytocola sp.]|uniref:CAP domain-containing protein n=1 Tax=Actinophytocola sp. TaxID=1872138 RepID=UPI002DDCF527|nr:CAP domain-containing protein [Actinophytocola sp.]HEV2780869.1 CAP domain-containing protein [Actinophytocola sp.]